jgi:hypothetical protein
VFGRCLEIERPEREKNAIQQLEMTIKRKRDEGQTTAIQPSVMQMEDAAFPRGGGSSVLTPLEIKQATNEAARDALFAVSIVL